MTRWRWTQPVCIPCWNERNPDRPAPADWRDDSGEGPYENCCLCDAGTTAGIYIRINPEDAHFPTLKDEG